MKTYKNLLNKGSVRYIIFKEDDIWYGVALEFNIVEEANDPMEVMVFLFDAIKGYVDSARRAKLRPATLNQTPTKEYKDLWQKLQSDNAGVFAEKKQVFSFGFQPLPFASVPV